MTITHRNKGLHIYYTIKTTKAKREHSMVVTIMSVLNIIMSITILAKISDIFVFFTLISGLINILSNHFTIPPPPPPPFPINIHACTHTHTTGTDMDLRLPVLPCEATDSWDSSSSGVVATMLASVSANPGTTVFCQPTLPAVLFFHSTHGASVSKLCVEK